jgi:hypothetical protein
VNHAVSLSNRASINKGVSSARSMANFGDGLGGFNRRAVGVLVVIEQLDTCRVRFAVLPARFQ